MGYSFEIKPSCRKDINKLCRKNAELRKAIESKISEILENPLHYKPLQYDLAGERRVHILKSFVLIFVIHENRHLVEFLKFDHHDNAFQR